MSKLTLNIEYSLIEAAKAYARRRGTSVSRLVARYFQQLEAAPARDEFFQALHEELTREGYQAPQNDLRSLRHRHVTAKYL